MKYFYVKGPVNVGLLNETTDEWTDISGLDDPRIKPGSLEEFTRYTGWLEIDEPIDVQLTLPLPDPQEPEKTPELAMAA